MTPGTILTERLELVPATLETACAALAGPESLQAALGVLVPESWPPEFLDPPALAFTRDRLAESPGLAEWWMYFVIHPRLDGGRTIIGSAGHKGPPSDDGTVEVGYGIVSDQRRNGYASETVAGLLGHAFDVPQVRRVIAETLPVLVASIGVLRKCGFRYIGAGAEPGVIRFEITRAEFT